MARLRPSRCSVFGPVLLSLILSSFILAQPTNPARTHFNVPADFAEVSLKRFAEQSGVQVVFATSAAGKVRTNAVKGDFMPRDALEVMVANTPLTVKQDLKTGALMVHRASAKTKSLPPPAGAPEKSPEIDEKKK